MMSSSIEDRIYSVVAQFVKDRGEILENDAIFGSVKDELEGTDIPGKTQSFYTQDFGTISHAKITKILKEKFKANSTSVGRDKTKKRALSISKQVLAQIGTAYEEPWRIQILPTSPSERFREGGNSDVERDTDHSMTGETICGNQQGSGTQDNAGTLEHKEICFDQREGEPDSGESLAEIGPIIDNIVPKSAQEPANPTTDNVAPPA